MGVGQTTPLQLVGSNVTETPSIDYPAPGQLPDAGDGSCTLDVSLSSNGSLLNPVPVVVTTLPVTLEPAGENNGVATAALIAVPLAVSGRIETEADIDCYAFDAKKDERISIEVLARRNGSALDSIVRLLNDKGNPVIENKI